MIEQGQKTSEQPKTIRQPLDDLDLMANSRLRGINYVSIAKDHELDTAKLSTLTELRQELRNRLVQVDDDISSEYKSISNFLKFFINIRIADERIKKQEGYKEEGYYPESQSVSSLSAIKLINQLLDSHNNFLKILPEYLRDSGQLLFYTEQVQKAMEDPSLGWLAKRIAIVRYQNQKPY